MFEQNSASFSVLEETLQLPFLRYLTNGTYKLNYFEEQVASQAIASDSTASDDLSSSDNSSGETDEDQSTDQDSTYDIGESDTATRR